MRKEHYSSEPRFKSYVLEYLIAEGHEISIQKQSNRMWKVNADIISKKNNVFHLSELKFCLVKPDLFKAIGQLIVYKYCYFPEEVIELNLIVPKDNCVFGIDEEFIKFLKGDHGINLLLL
jgi:hypothetical protein